MLGDHGRDPADIEPAIDADAAMLSRRVTTVAEAISFSSSPRSSQGTPRQLGHIELDPAALQRLHGGVGAVPPGTRRRAARSGRRRPAAGGDPGVHLILEHVQRHPWCRCSGRCWSPAAGSRRRRPAARNRTGRPPTSTSNRFWSPRAACARCLSSRSYRRRRRPRVADLVAGRLPRIGQIALDLLDDVALAQQRVLVRVLRWRSPAPEPRSAPPAPPHNRASTRPSNPRPG